MGWTGLNDDFFEAMESSIRDVNEAEMLPPSCYADPAFFEFEKEALFLREWLCVGRESWISEPGDYFTAEQIGERVIVVRQQDGSIRALSAVCQHRAMLVAEGRGKTRNFLCPYHHWAYGLDGTLTGAPAMERACNFDKSKYNLPVIKVEVWLGFVFINFDPDAAPLSPRLTAITEVLKNYHVETAEESAYPGEPSKEYWNWKVRFENSNDGYHANRLHAGPVHNIVPSALASFPELPKDTAGYFRYNQTLHMDASFNPTLKAVLPVFPGLTPDERHRMLFINVPPTLFIVGRSETLTYNIFFVQGPEEMSAQRGWMVPPGVSDLPLFKERLQMNVDGSKPIFEQDRHVDEQVQIGLRSRYANRGRYSWQEKSQQEFNRWLVERYRNHWKSLKIAKQAPPVPEDSPVTFGRFKVPPPRSSRNHGQ
jgi:phenylpropionate dioxygenase-like ring-hydroxylating dioxygenase large terminal subunit